MANYRLGSEFKVQSSKFITQFLDFSSRLLIFFNFQIFQFSIFQSFNLKIFKFVFTFLILNSSFYIAFSQDTIDGHSMNTQEKKDFCEAATIWRGFFHEWNYNHRTNRLGDYIVQNNASGSGKDHLEFTSFYTQVKTSSAHFLMNTVEFELKGDEGEITKKSIKISKKAAEELKGFSKYYVFLNGFDLYSDSTAGSDKMFKLSIYPQNLHVDSATGEYSLDVDINFGADCNSMECNFRAKNQFYSYHCTVAYVIVAGNAGINIAEDSLSNFYSWNKVLEIFKEENGIKSSAVKSRNSNHTYFPNAIMGIKSFDFLVQPGLRIKDEATHMLAMDLAVHPEGYEPKTNSYYYHTSLFFKPWTQKMRMLANRSSGSADFKMNVYMLQLADEDARIKHLEYSNRYHWKTRILKQTPSTNPNAVRKYNAPYGNDSIENSNIPAAEEK